MTTRTMRKVVWIFFLVWFTREQVVHSHYCTNSSNGLVPPSDNHVVESLCNYAEGTPLRVTISDGQPDVLYKFGGPGQTGLTYLFSTCGFTDDSLDTGLSVWSPTNGGTLVDCDDDSCVLQRKASSLVFTVPDDGEYVLRPWMYDGSPGVFEFGYFSGGGCAATSGGNNATSTTMDWCANDPDETTCRQYCDTWQCQKNPILYQDVCNDAALQYASSTSKPLPCSCATLQLTLQTDAWSNETSVLLESLSNGTQLWNFAQGSFTESFHSYVTEEHCLDPSQCYQLTIQDLWADGICCYSGLGSYQIQYEGTIVASGGDFEASATHLFGNCP